MAVVVTLVLSVVGVAPTDALVRRELGAPAIGDREVSGKLLPVLRGQWLPGISISQTFFPQSVASGDPRPDSVVLWTRVEDPGLAAVDLPVRLIVTKDIYFANVVFNQVLTAKAQYDHCVKFKLTGLQPRTTYYYFFVYYQSGNIYLSRMGRTKTAPAPGDAVPVRFAFISCQDYIGRYYNGYLKLLNDHRNDLDFVVHLGDYVYETTGDPTFQNPSPGRTITFTDTAGAIQLGSAEAPYYGASSLSNYRELYKTYRTDPVLQQVHENFPFIVVWDDHEYSNDAWGDVATYTNGRRDEKDSARRRRAEQAYFEFLPIDVGLDATGNLDLDSALLYPSTRIWRDFRYGANLHLVMTDSRTFRPDHLVAEDAFPGRVVLNRLMLETILTPAGYAAIAPALDPYVAVASDPVLQATLTAVVTQLYLLENPALAPAEAVAKAQAAVSGDVSATYITAAFVAVGLPPPFTPAQIAGMDRGLPYLLFGKQRLYDSTGSRYVLAKDSYSLYSQVLWALTQGASENVFGAVQEGWIRQTLTTSAATWKVLASSISMTPMVLDFTNPAIAAVLPPGFPAAYRTRLQINADQWDGFPNKRAQLLGLLAGLSNAVVISGDIHASFVADHGNGVFEFTGTSMSAGVLEYEVLNTVMADPILSQVPGIDQLVAQLGTLLQVSSLDPRVSASPILYDATGANGFVLVEVGADALTASYYHIDTEQTFTSYYSNPGALDTLFSRHSFRVQGGHISPLP
jgi:alkaline phosphatase D